MDGAVLQARAPVVLVAVVVDVEVLVLRVRDLEDLLVRGVAGARRDALTQRRREREGLERRARLAVSVGRQVEGVVLEVVAADHRLDLSGRVVDHDDRGGRRDAGEGALRDVLCGVLHVEVQRAVDLVATAEGAPGAVEVDDLLAQPGGEVGGERVVRRALDVRGDRDLRGGPFVVLRLGDVALVEHVLQHQVAAVRRGLRIDPRGERRGGGDDSGQHRRLGRRQVLGAWVLTAATAGSPWRASSLPK